MRNIKLTIEYDGKKFNGWQKQPNKLNIQGEIETAIKEITGEYPVLLLDDVLSELDFNRKRYVLTSIKNIQTVITCTGIEDLTSYLDENSKVFRVINGRIQC